MPKESIRLKFRDLDCTLCGSCGYTVLRKKTEREPTEEDIKAMFSYEELSLPGRKNYCGQIVRCAQCGLVYMNPQFAGMDRHYEDAVDDFYLSTASGRIATFERDMRIINRLQKKKGRMLDIACSTGMLLDIGRKEGWKERRMEGRRHRVIAVGR